MAAFTFVNADLFADYIMKLFRNFHSQIKLFSPLCHFQALQLPLILFNVFVCFNAEHDLTQHSILIDGILAKVELG